MEREYYRKIMQKKKINKIYSKSIVMTLLTMGTSLPDQILVNGEGR